MALLALLIIVVLWQLIVALLRPPTYIFPSPYDVLGSFLQFAGILGTELIATVEEVFGGFALAIAIGIPTAVLIAFVRPLARLLYPLIVTSQSVPIVAIAPVLLAWFGITYLTELLIVALIAVFPIIMNTTAGLLSFDPDMMVMARSTRAKWFRIFWHVRFPGALPNILAGLKMAATLSVIGAVVGEFVAGTRGVGYIILSAQGSLQMPLAFAGIVILALLGIGLFHAVEFVERRLIPWHSSQRGTATT
jgi:NitT/TauT family transport system permease protein